MEFITENMKAVILALIAVIAAGAVITIKFKKNKNSNNVVQNNNTTNGDIVGRDKTQGK